MTPDPLAERDLRSALRDHVRDPNVTGATVHALDGDRVRVELDRVAFDMLLRLPDEADYDPWDDGCTRDHLDDADTAELLDQLAENGPLTDAERAALKAVLDAER